MNKRKYQIPDLKVVLVESSSILAGSTGATGEDAPWASAQMRNSRYDKFGNEDLNLYFEDEK